MTSELSYLVFGIVLLAAMFLIRAVNNIRRRNAERVYTRKEFEKGLERLGQLAQQSGLTIYIQIFGGGAMVFKFRSRPSTRDLDVVIQADRETVLELTQQVAQELGWDPEWLNDKVSNSLWGSSDGEQVLSAPGIVATVASVEQLLANKLYAFRHARDQNDAELLMKQLLKRHKYRTMQESWGAIWGHVRKGDERWARRNHIIIWNKVTKQEVQDDSQDFKWWD